MNVIRAIRLRLVILRRKEEREGSYARTLDVGMVTEPEIVRFTFVGVRKRSSEPCVVAVRLVNGKRTSNGLVAIVDSGNNIPARFPSSSIWNEVLGSEEGSYLWPLDVSH
jgi:hypothetical protein